MSDSTIVNSEYLAKKVLNYFDGLGGFDHWYDDIDDETKSEIFMGLVKIITK